MILPFLWGEVHVKNISSRPDEGVFSLKPLRWDFARLQAPHVLGTSAAFNQPNVKRLIHRLSTARVDPLPSPPHSACARFGRAQASCVHHNPANGPLSSSDGGSNSHRMTGGNAGGCAGGLITRIKVWLTLLFFRLERRPNIQAMSRTAT